MSGLSRAQILRTGGGRRNSSVGRGLYPSDSNRDWSCGSGAPQESRGHLSWGVDLGEKTRFWGDGGNRTRDEGFADFSL